MTYTREEGRMLADWLAARHREYPPESLGLARLLQDLETALERESGGSAVLSPATVARIEAERRRQNAKWGRRDLAEMRPERVLAVLMEEVGEVAAAILEFNEHQDLGRIEAELVQVAAVACWWLDECFPAGRKP